MPRSVDVQKLDIQSDGTHEEVHAAQTLTAHSRWQCLRQGNCVEDTLLHSKNKACLLVVVGTHTHSSKELPNIDVLSGVDAARENVKKRVL